ERPDFWHALSPLGAPAPTEEEQPPTRSVLLLAGGLADRRPLRGPRHRHEARPTRPASRARPRAARWRGPAARLPRRPPLPQGASARGARRGTGPPQRRAALGDGAVRHRLAGGPDDVADARCV